MANPNEERNGQTVPNDPGFNTVRNSSIEKRQKNQLLQKYTLFGVVATVALIVVMLVVLLIGAIASSVGDNDDGNKGPGKADVEWANLTLYDTDTKHGDLLLVDGTHEYVFPEIPAGSTVPEHLSKIVDVLLSHPSPRPYQQVGLSEYMDTDALLALDSMLVAFHAATGKNNVSIRYAYRSFADQEALGSSTKPGFSDHHTGLGCELRYIPEGTQNNVSVSEDPTIYAWLTENCHKYGFIVRYPADKVEKTGVENYSSYFRYVGVAHATYMKQNNLCLEEYIELLKGYSQDKPLKINGADGNYYEICYIAVSGSEAIKCPTNYVHNLSGTNEGGVVLTINRSEVIAEETNESSSDSGTDTVDLTGTQQS